MANRFVRNSLYRHVFAKESKHDDKESYASIKNSGDSIAASYDRFAVSHGNSGAVSVLSLDDGWKGRVPCAYTLHGHKGKVLDMHFSPFTSTLLATASEDSTVAVFQLPKDLEKKGKSSAIGKFKHYKKVVSVQWNPTSSGVLASASSDSAVRIWDVDNNLADAKLKIEFPGIDLTAKVAWNQLGSQLLVPHTDDSKKKSYFKIIDPRNSEGGSSVEGLSKGHYLFADNHNMIVGCGSKSGGSRIVYLWDPRKLDKHVSSANVDTSNSELFPHYEPDNSVLFVTGKGDTTTRFYEIADGKLFALTAAKHKKSLKAVTYLPRRNVNVAGCEIASMLAKTSDRIIPTAFIVPRKSDMFQEDLFPDTISHQILQKGAEWFEGKNPTAEDLKKETMDPEKKGEVKEVVVEIARSAEDYEKEIAALKAEIAALKAKYE